MNPNYFINNQCCTNCKTENRWLSFKINNLNVIVGGIYRHLKSNIIQYNTALNDIFRQESMDSSACPHISRMTITQLQ